MNNSHTGETLYQNTQIVSDAYEYLVDRTQRYILFLDILRKRGNTYLDHLEKGQPPILIFDYEIIMDGRTFEQPVNYTLVRILDRRQEKPDRRQKEPKDPDRTKETRRLTLHGKSIDSEGLPSRPIVVIDPRAGHGPGIGGSKLNSQIGVALDYGHPVYFILFYTDPEPGQNISHVQQAEVRFLKEILKRHPDAPKPAIIGNCQAGWATALIGADCPEITGPMIFNGSPLSYWGGVEGSNPMRYKGGLTGGIWLTSLWSDLGNDKFDGANLVAGFEDLNPANTYWGKYYHLFTNIDTEEKRFLNFEKWWGGFFMMNAEEINFIVESLFIGNELEKGYMKLDDGRSINLKNIKNPILAFASEGDNITPPPQALNWIHKVYGSVEEIKRCGQIIIYMVHKKIGHLGIFVSGSVAKKEHNQILGNLGWLDYLAPGLYEMVIDESSNISGLDDYEVRFKERQMEDIFTLDDGFADEEPFIPVNHISKFNDLIYRLFFRPWIKNIINEPVSESIRQLHPLRTQRYTMSDKNPLCVALQPIAETVSQNRRVANDGNFFVEMEKIFSDSIINSLNYFRDIRDASQEQLFKTIYDTPWMANYFSYFDNHETTEDESTDEKRKRINREKTHYRDLAEQGGYIEACVRVMLAAAGKDNILNVSELKIAEDIIHSSKRLRKLTPEEFKDKTKEQAMILHIVPRKALTSFAQMKLSKSDKKKIYSIAEKIVTVDNNMGPQEEAFLRSLEQILLEK